MANLVVGAWVSWVFQGQELLFEDEGIWGPQAHRPCSQACHLQVFLSSIISITAISLSTCIVVLIVFIFYPGISQESFCHWVLYRRLTFHSTYVRGCSRLLLIACTPFHYIAIGRPLILRLAASTLIVGRLSALKMRRM
jgi:hypothetical protein